MNAKKKIAIVAVALVGVLGAGLAEARDRSDVQLSVTIGAPGYLPAYGPAVEVYRPAVRPHVVPQRPTRWDRDGDGIPNRYDRVYNPRWDRDGDGVPNRYDRRPNRPDNGWQNGGYGRDGRGYGR
ncbi:MAG: hypothetical protein ABIS28_12420 [Caldimonas sp.]